MQGAGGTDGGVFRFLLGLGMFIAGAYLLLDAIQVTWGMALFRVGSFNVTSGFVMIPFIIGIILLFFNANNPLGWLLSIGALLMLVIGVITNTQFVLRPMSAFELITILVLCFGGLGLFLSSLRGSSSKP
jgi:ABC-type Na+ efflux pump permease subunit